MDLMYATTNRGKVEGLRARLDGFGISLEAVDLELSEPQESLEEITRSKVRQAYSVLKKPVVVMDTGLSLDAFPGWPGAFVKHDLEGLGLDGFLKLLDGQPRGARFEQCMGYMGPGTLSPEIFHSYDRGSLSTCSRGSLDDKPWLYSDLSRLFIPDGASKTHAEMSRSEFRSWKDSLPPEHDVNAVFADWLARQVFKIEYVPDDS